MYNTRHTSIAGLNLADILGHVLVAASDRFWPLRSDLEYSFQLRNDRIWPLKADSARVPMSPIVSSLPSILGSSRLLYGSEAPHPCSICVPFLPWNCSVRSTNDVPIALHKSPAPSYEMEQNGTKWNTKTRKRLYWHEKSISAIALDRSDPGLWTCLLALDGHAACR